MAARRVSSRLKPRRYRYGAERKQRADQKNGSQTGHAGDQAEKRAENSQGYVKERSVNERYASSMRSLITPSTGSKVTSFVMPPAVIRSAFCVTAALCQPELWPL